MGTMHTIASCFIFDPKGRLLLLQRHRNDWGGGLWATPAGSIETSETPEAALRREVKEETGLDISEVDFLGVHHITMPHGETRMHSFKTHLSEELPVSIRADEHEAYQWFDLATLLAEANIIWATPTILRDFGLLPHFDEDPTLADGSTAILITSSENIAPRKDAARKIAKA